MPGFISNRYPAPILYQLLRGKLPLHTPIFGGVASADDPARIRSGTLFADKEVLRNAIVAASVAASIPLGISLKHGLTDTDRLLRVSDLSRDRRTIYSFREGSPADIMARECEASPVVLFSEVCTRRDPTVDDPILSPDGTAIQLAREISENTYFRVLCAKPDEIHNAALEAVNDAMTHTGNPVACLLFKCIGLLRYRQKIGLDFESELTSIESGLNTHHWGMPPDCVGAFVDGEAGVDENGKSLLGNWSTAAMVFGDELMDHALVHSGFARLADLAKHPLSTPEESINRLLQLIHEIGLRGAMISFWMPDQQEEMIVAKAAVGSRFKKIVDITRCSIHGDDILAIVAREKRPRYIPDSRLTGNNCAQDAVSQSGIISQYIIPLMDRDRKVNAILQIDLGDTSYKQELHPHEYETLNAIGDIVISILNRVFSGEESRITIKLDEAMKECIGADTVNEGLQKFLELAIRAFGLKMGHIRLAQEDRHSLGIVAGIGRLYDAMKRSRSETKFGDGSPLAQAFRQGEFNIVNDIVNDPANNRDHQWMCDRYKERDRELYEALKAVGSYANVPFLSESNERGTICLFTSNPWFFTWYHNGALGALSARAGFLLDTLRRKYSERFLLSAIPRLPQIQNPGDPGKVLANVTDRFARSIKAEYASLFLWDEDQKLHILRAQYGWHNPEWVNAARYGKGETWAGSTTIAGAPRHIPNLVAFYDDLGYPPERGRYNEQIFGRELSGSFTVEAIGLPLRIGNEQVGVMMLYRKIREGQPSGFLTTDQELLIAGAASLTGLVKLVQANSYERWEKDEFRRHQEIYEACASKDEAEPFEARICRQTLTSYRAISVDFYSVATSSAFPEWKAGLRRSSKTEKIIPAVDGFMTIERAEFARLARFKEPLPWPRKLLEGELKNPQWVATAGVVERVCVPLLAENQLVGLLNVRWLINGRQANPDVFRHSDVHWQLLGQKIGAAYRQYQLAKNQEESERMKAEAERIQRQAEMMKRELEEQSGLAVKATGAYVFQSLHRLANAIQNIRSLPIIIEKTESETERADAIQALKEAMRSAASTVESVKDIGERVVNPRRDDRSLADLIRPALEETQAEKFVSVNLDMPTLETITVQVDPEQTKQCFINLINNAVEAMKGKERRELTIAASHSGAYEVTISIKDTGKGMTDEEIQAALRGFVSTHHHKGVGVLITNVLLNAQRGSLNYRRNGNEGIEAIITLKSPQNEVKS
ncbi:MAG: GAF domain-containing protein [Blastocatellia bacterium]